MPQFYFHLHTPSGLELDEHGLALVDLEAAYLEAWASIPDITADLARSGLSPMPYSFHIADAAGETLMEVPFAERLRDPRRLIRPSQHIRARKLSGEIMEVIGAARETLQRSREILARSSSSV